MSLLASYRAEFRGKKGRQVLIEIFVKIEDLIQEIKKKYLTHSLIFISRKPIFGNFDETFFKLGKSSFYLGLTRSNFDGVFKTLRSLKIFGVDCFFVFLTL